MTSQTIYLSYTSANKEVHQVDEQISNFTYTLVNAINNHIPIRKKTKKKERWE